MTKLTWISFLIALGIFGTLGCSAQPSQEALTKITQLRTELETLKSEIQAADEKSAKYAGGLLKALVETRLETLKNTEALVNQRIHALESGAKIDISIPGIEPDPELAQRLAKEIENQEKELEQAKQEAARYSGGLVAAMKNTTVATAEQTLAMLTQRRLAATYGLPVVKVTMPAEKPRVSSGKTPPKNEGVTQTDAGRHILQVKLLEKKFTKQSYQDYIFFDLEFTATGLEKPARAIKGILHLQDLFGEIKMNIKWTIEEPVVPNQTVVEKGTGFDYNQFRDAHQWVRSTDLEDMTVSMTVKNILYLDGTRVDFEDP